MFKTDFLKNLSSNKLFGLLAISTVVVGSMIFFIIVLTKSNFTTLYKNLSHDDIRLISVKLGELGEEYEIDYDNNSIAVSAGRTNNVRMILAQDGLPTSGEFSNLHLMQDESLFGSTEFQNSMNLTKLMEQKLVNSINVISHIENSRVHLVLSQNRPFNKSGIDASASIILKLRAGKKLTQKEINAISHLVAKSVPELSVNNITIIDHRGNPLKLANLQDLTTPENLHYIEYQMLVENKLKHMIENLLESHVGQNKVKVSVTATIKSDKEVIVSEIYDPDSQVIRSKKSSSEKERENLENKNISVANNIPNSNQMLGNGDDNFDLSKSNEITNYEISKKVINKVIESGSVEKLSVAVLVDGIYQNNDKNHPIYTARSNNEIEQIKELVKSAVGYNEQRGDIVTVVNLKFTDEVNSLDKNNAKHTSFPKISSQILQLIIIGGVAVLVIFIIFRPMIQKFLNDRGLPFSGTQAPDIADLTEEKEKSASSDFEQVRIALNDAIFKDIDKSAALLKKLLHNNKTS